MINLLITLAEQLTLRFAALASMAGFVAFIVKWILAFLKSQAKENAKMQEKQLLMRGTEVEIQTKVHNSIVLLVDKIEKQNGHVIKAVNRNTEAMNDLCSTINKRFDTKAFKGSKQP